MMSAQRQPASHVVSSSFRPEVAGFTDVGLRRANEDRMMMLPEQRFIAVADGMGGCQRGADASAAAIDTLAELRSMGICDEALLFLSPEALVADDDDARFLAAAMHIANTRIRLCRQSSEEKMGTTLVAALFSEDGRRVTIANVGDSRCYRIRNGEITLLTFDHSVAAEALTRAPWLSVEAQALLPRNVLTRALGVRPEVRADISSLSTRIDDRYLLCSDGLWSAVSSARMLEIVEGAPDLDAACELLVAEAKANGARDNITVVLATIGVPAPRRSGVVPSLYEDANGAR